MEKNLAAQSFIVRVYRTDTEDLGKIAGLVEALDGSCKPEPFRSADELVRLLNGATSNPGQGTNVRKAPRGKGGPRREK